MTKRILISGYTGFVGANLVNHLYSKFALYGVSRDYKKKPGLLEECYSWNGLSVDNIKEIDCIVHLAGKAHDLKNTTNEAEYFAVNTGLTIILFDLFIESSARDFIYLSSVKAVADSVESILYESGTIPQPATAYGKSKQEAERYLLSKKLPKGKRLFILRPCMIHGPGNKGNLNLLYNFVKKGIPFPLAAFKNKRSFLSIGNLIYIIEKLIDCGSISGGIYNVSDDKPLSTSEVVKIIAKASGARQRLWAVNPKFIAAFARMGDKLHLPLNSDRLKKLTESYVVSNCKIKEALQIEYLPVSSHEGIEETVKSFNEL